MMFLMQCLSMFTYLFIVLIFLFIFSFFDILPNLCDFINFHRNTSRIAFARMENQCFRFSIYFRDASTSSVPVVMRLSSSSIRGMPLMVSVLFMIRSLILSVCSIMLCLKKCFEMLFVFCYPFDIV